MTDDPAKRRSSDRHAARLDASRIAGERLDAGPGSGPDTPGDTPRRPAEPPPTRALPGTARFTEPEAAPSGDGPTRRFGAEPPAIEPTHSVDGAEPATPGRSLADTTDDDSKTSTRSAQKRPTRTSRRLVEEMPPPVEPTAAPTSLEVPLGVATDPLSNATFTTRKRRLVSGRLERSLLSLEDPASDAPPAIEVRSLQAGYGERTVLRDVSFQVRRGEILAILGGSGSGKTTLLRHMIGLMRSERGTIKLGGRDIGTLEGDDLAVVLKSIGMLFQYSALFSGLSVGENVGLPLREYTDLPDAAIHAIVRLKLALVGLPGIENRMPSELSGGMKKRVALARAVALDPDVVFFDEPGSGLDPIAAAELDKLIVHLNRALGTTMVIVTHDLENAFNVAHRILVLDRGLVVACGTPDEVRASNDPWVRSFLARESSGRDAPDEAFYARIAGAGRAREKDEP